MFSVKQLAIFPTTLLASSMNRSSLDSQLLFGISSSVVYFVCDLPWPTMMVAHVVIKYVP
jgi:hypothetical protein